METSGDEAQMKEVSHWEPTFEGQVLFLFPLFFLYSLSILPPSLHFLIVVKQASLCPIIHCLSCQSALLEPRATEPRKHSLELLKPWVKINPSSLQGDTTQGFCHSGSKLMNTTSSAGRLLSLNNHIDKQRKLFKCFYQILEGLKHTVSSSVQTF